MVLLALACAAVLIATAALALLLADAARARVLVYGACLAVALVLLLIALLALLGVSRGPLAAVLPLGIPWLGAHFRLDALAAFFLAVVSLGAAAASASTSFIRESTLPRITPSLDSIRWIVGSESPARWARSRWSISSSARAARIWGPVIMSQISDSLFRILLFMPRWYDLK